MALTATAHELVAFLDGATQIEERFFVGLTLDANLIECVVEMRRLRQLAEEAIHRLARAHGAKA